MGDRSTVLCSGKENNMGLKKLLVTFLLLGVLTAAVVLYLCPELISDREPRELEDEWWGRGPLPTDASKFPKDKTDIRKYTVKVEESVLKDLMSRLNNTRYVEALDNVQFQYGFHSSYLKEVITYWRTKYDWRKHEKQLNTFEHFVTQIEGIDVHFIHQKPNLQSKKLRVLPLLLVHGWPGSVYEFYKILPLLTTPREGKDYVFEVICPSIPGHGFSEAPHQPGFSRISAARVFTKLMDRLGHKTFYAQGGDWGAVINSVIGALYPEKVLGLHLNLVNIKIGLITSIKYAIGYLFPSLFMSPEEHAKIYPLKDFVVLLLQEMGYAHIQATKPDTVGTALADSPAGLAAYILENFSSLTDKSFRDLPDGGLTKKFTLDELLTNVMIYWSTNTITSSQRFFKEMFHAKARFHDIDTVPIKVPTGIAAFPNEIRMLPEKFCAQRFRNIVLYSQMPRGGHFPALEEPKLLADEIWNFVIQVEKAGSEKK